MRVTFSEVWLLHRCLQHCLIFLAELFSSVQIPWPCKLLSKIYSTSIFPRVLFSPGNNSFKWSERGQNNAFAAFSTKRGSSHTLINLLSYPAMPWMVIRKEAGLPVAGPYNISWVFILILCTITEQLWTAAESERGQILLTQLCSRYSNNVHRCFFTKMYFTSEVKGP